MYLECSKQKYEKLKQYFDEAGINYSIINTSFLDIKNAYCRFEFGAADADLAKQILSINERVSMEVGESCKMSGWLKRILDRDKPVGNQKIQQYGMEK